jgi:hypothetical protein
VFKFDMWRGSDHWYGCTVFADDLLAALDSLRYDQEINEYLTNPRFRWELNGDLGSIIFPGITPI